MCGVKTFATLDKTNVCKVFLKIKQHNVNMASKIAYNIKIISQTTDYQRPWTLNLAEEKEWQSAKHGKLTGLKFVFNFL